MTFDADDAYPEPSPFRSFIGARIHWGDGTSTDLEPWDEDSGLPSMTITLRPDGTVVLEDEP